MKPSRYLFVLLLTASLSHLANSYCESMLERGHCTRAFLRKCASFVCELPPRNKRSYRPWETNEIPRDPLQDPDTLLNYLALDKPIPIYRSKPKKFYKRVIKSDFEAVMRDCCAPNGMASAACKKWMCS